MKHFFIILLAYVYVTLGVQAQPPSQIIPQPSTSGTEFYFSFPTAYLENSGPVIYCRVFVVSDVDQNVTVEVPGKNWKQTKFTPALYVVEFTIPNGIAQVLLKNDQAPAPPEQVYAKSAVHVTSVSPIIVYGVTNAEQRYDEGFLAIPVTSLGTDYVISSYPQVNSGVQMVSETTISSAYNDTEVTFEMGGTASSQTSGGITSGKSSKFILNKGDVLSLTSGGDKQDLSGSRITSTKPVAVVSGNQCANVPAGVTGCGYLAEMELPASAWGKEYHISSIYGRKKSSILRIYAKEKNTSIFRNGVPWFVLPKNTSNLDDGYAERRITDGGTQCGVLTADKPIYVVQYNPGQTDDDVASVPFQMVLTPFEQYRKVVEIGTPSLRGNPDNIKLHYMNLIFRLAAGQNLPEDLEFGVVVNSKIEWKKVSVRFGSTPGCIFPVPTDGHTYACKSITLPGGGVYRIRANTPFAVYQYGFGDKLSYGYTAGTLVKDLASTDGLPPRPTWTQLPDGTIENAKVRDFPEDNSVRSNLGLMYINLHPDSSYNYEFSFDKNNLFVAGQTQEIDWSLKPINPYKKARAELVFIDHNGNDTSIVITYQPLKEVVTLSDRIDFGLLKPGQMFTRTVAVTNTTASTGIIQRLELVTGSRGFSIENVGLPFTVASGATIGVGVTFTATKNGIFDDQIGIGDSSIFTKQTILTAEVATPSIQVDNSPYGTRQVYSRTAAKNIRLRNTGRVDMVLTGDNHKLALAGTPFEVVDWDITYPRVVKAGEVLEFHVDFAPKVKGTYAATITFASDSDGADSLLELSGVAVDTITAVENDGLNNQVSECSFTLTPNPINRDGGSIEYTLLTRKPVTITIYSSTGEKIVTLVNSTVDVGNYQASIPVERLSAGAYRVRMTAGESTIEQSLVIVK